LRHRIGITYEAEAENITVDINKIINEVEVPKILDFDTRFWILDLKSSIVNR
jgi:hypothetical protein